MKFREAIRDLPQAVVDDFFRAPEDPELRSLPNYAAFIHLIWFHQLPRTEEERRRAELQSRRSWDEFERRSAEARAAAKEQKAVRREQQRRISAEKHQQRQIEGAGRKDFRFEVARRPMVERIEAFLSQQNLPPGFFSIRPVEIDDRVVAQMSPSVRSAFAQRISYMHHRSWRALQLRLQCPADL